MDGAGSIYGTNNIFATINNNSIMGSMTNPSPFNNVTSLYHLNE
jgi:hypothetical protein